VNELIQSPKSAALEPKLRAVTDYAVALTHDPGSMTEQHLQPLRQAEYSDEAILWIAEIVGYFNYVNRLADGLGVSLEPHKSEPQT